MKIKTLPGNIRDVLHIHADPPARNFLTCDNGFEVAVQITIYLQFGKICDLGRKRLFFRTFHRAIHGILIPVTSYPGLFDFWRTRVRADQSRAVKNRMRNIVNSSRYKQLWILILKDSVL